MTYSGDTSATSSGRLSASRACIGVPSCLALRLRSYYELAHFGRVNSVAVHLVRAEEGGKAGGVYRRPDGLSATPCHGPRCLWCDAGLFDATRITESTAKYSTDADSNLALARGIRPSTRVEGGDVHARRHQPPPLCSRTETLITVQVIVNYYKDNRKQRVVMDAARGSRL